MIELITISQANQMWYLNKVYVNPNHVVMVTGAEAFDKMLKEGRIDLALDKNISFSEVKMNPITGYDKFIVVGSPRVIMEKMNKNTKQLLKG